GTVWPPSTLRSRIRRSAQTSASRSLREPDRFGTVEVGSIRTGRSSVRGAGPRASQALHALTLQVIGSHCHEATPWNRRHRLDSPTTFLGRTAQATLLA